MELRAIVNFAIWHDTRDITDTVELPTTHYDRPTMRKCWDFLDLTSRSFARVIRELEGELARTVRLFLIACLWQSTGTILANDLQVCLFYLVLRALDTVEDDMTIPNDVKIPLLRAMHTKLYEPGWTFKESKEKDKIVLEEFDAIQTEFSLLDHKYVHNACRLLGRGADRIGSGTRLSLPIFARRWVLVWPTLPPLLPPGNL